MIVIKGEFKDGRKNGYGTCKWSNGNVYEGEFKDCKLNGYEIYVNVNGRILEGYFKDGEYISSMD